MAQDKNLVVLVAGMGTRLRPITDNLPKCLVPVAGKPILEWTLEAAKRAGFEKIILVGGYKHELLEKYECTLVINEQFDKTNMVESLFMASSHFGNGFTLCYGDIICEDTVFRKLIEAKGEIKVVTDLDWLSYWNKRFTDPLDDAESFRFGPGGIVSEIGQKARSISEIEGQYIGLLSFDEVGVETLVRTYEQQRDKALKDGLQEKFNSIYMTDLLQMIIKQGKMVKAVPVHGGWVEIDSISDLNLAEDLIKRGRLTKHSRNRNEKSISL